MMIPALIMAGGKGSRMGIKFEKPLLPFLSKPLIDWVAEAVIDSRRVSEFHVVTSVNTPKTEEHCLKKGWKIVRTDGKGYHDDLRQAVSKADLMGAVLTMPSDVPAITGRFIDKVISDFEVCGEEYLAVFVPIKARLDLGLSISSTDEYDDEWYAVSGVNIINGNKITTDSKVKTSAIVTQEIEVLLNINTIKDLEIAEKLLSKNS